MTLKTAHGHAPSVDQAWVRDLVAYVGLELQLADFDTPDGDHVPGRASEEQAVAWLTEQLDSISQLHWALRGRFESSSSEVLKLADEVSILLRRALTKMGYDPSRAEGLVDPRFLHAGLQGVVPREAGAGYEQINVSVSAVADLQRWFEQLARLLEANPAELRQSRANEWDQDLRDRLADCFRRAWKSEPAFSRGSHTGELHGSYLRFLERTLGLILGRTPGSEAIYKAFVRQRAKRSG
ncbi:MAG: hypothetical protein ACK4SZ_06790 [Allosphingosinicella sp.]|uniref:hypothetical protein n=1 Tax=Allosphingosinicella sp. TaxID=2823234 RepID=UPI0039398C2E